MERYENFFIKDRPYLDKLVFRIIKDPQALLLSLESGEVQFAHFRANPRNLKRLEKSDRLNLTPKGYAAIGPLNWLAFNMKKAPLDDVRVRKAIAYAVDRNFITKALMAGTAKQATGPLSPDNPFYTAEVEHYDLDIDKANSLLDEADLKPGNDGMRFAIEVDYIPGGAMHKEMAEYLKPQLKKIGIDVSVRTSPDFPTWAKRVGGHEFDISWDIVFHWGDPVIGVHRTYLCDNIRQGVIWSNTQSYCNPKVDQILAAAGKEMDPEKRKAFYHEFQKIVVDELPLYVTNVLPYHTVYSKKLGNPPQTIWGASSPMDETYWIEQP